jgi:hypothetical protein
VEVTTQACGINGYGDTTVKLSRQQYHELEQYLVDFRARLNQTTTREEAVPLFKEAVVELDKHGLLPKGMSVEKAQKLVIGQFQDKKLMELQEKLFQNRGLVMDNNTNYFCLIEGFGSPVCFYRPSWVFCYNYLPLFLFPLLYTLVCLVVYLLVIIAIIYSFYPIKLLSCISLGNLYRVMNFDNSQLSAYNNGNDHYYPFLGHINTIGLNGNKRWEGPLYGAINEVGWGVFGTSSTDYIGVGGFSGINIYLPKDKVFFLGAALRVKISLGSFPF